MPADKSKPKSLIDVDEKLCLDLLMAGRRGRRILSICADTASQRSSSLLPRYMRSPVDQCVKTTACLYSHVDVLGLTVVRQCACRSLLVVALKEVNNKASRKSHPSRVAALRQRVRACYLVGLSGVCRSILEVGQV